MKKKINVRAPNGFRVKYRFEQYRGEIHNVYCELFDMSNNHYAIGQVELVRYRKGTFATHSNLDTKYWNQGLGRLIYSKAIAWALNHGYKVRSSGGSSDMAKRVWSGKGLRQLFDIQKKVKRYTYSSTETWYAYRKGSLSKKKGKRK
jgi:GNAT superfamily N-acetyltransferase